MKTWWFMILILIAALGGVAVAVWGWSNHTICNFKDCHDVTQTAVETWGQTGDFFGGIINPFFTLLGLIFVGITIRQNEKEIKLSSDALQTQVDTAEKQRFETTFFQLLSLFNGTVKNLSFIENMNDNPEDGKSVIRLYRKLCADIKSSKQGRMPDIEKINFVYGEFYEGCGYMLGNYFDTLYSTIKFVDNGKFSEVDKKFYTDLICSQLSAHELSLLFYTCLLSPKYEKHTSLSLDFLPNFLPLVDKYKLLKNLDTGLLSFRSDFDLLNPAIADLTNSQV